jgi:hypothetical protein
MRFSESRPGTDCTPFARDVLREAAKAAKDRIGHACAPDSWTEFAEWLELEANR